MQIEIDDLFKELILEQAKAHNVSTATILESSFTFTLCITQLPKEKQETIKQWVEEFREVNEIK